MQKNILSRFKHFRGGGIWENRRKFENILKILCEKENFGYKRKGKMKKDNKISRQIGENRKIKK